MRRLVAAFVMAWAATVSSAQMSFTDATQFETRFGLMSVVGGEVDNFIHFRDQVYEDLWGAQVAILGAIGRGDETFDWVLLRRETGANACFPIFTLVRASADGLLISPEFGTCDSEPLDMRVLSGSVEVMLTHPDAAIETESVIFDGQSLTSGAETVSLPDAPAGAGPEVLRWLGQHPHAVFDDLSERARFATIMPINEINALANHVSVADVVAQEGDWVIGRGCLAHQCDVARGLWGIRIADGAVGAAILGGNNYVAFYGLAETDPTLRAAVEAHRR